MTAPDEDQDQAGSVAHSWPVADDTGRERVVEYEVRLNVSDAEQAGVDWMPEQIHKRTRGADALAELGSWALRHVARAELMEAAAHIISRELSAEFVEVFHLDCAHAEVHRVARVGFGQGRPGGIELSTAPLWLETSGLEGDQHLVVHNWGNGTPAAQQPELQALGISCSMALPIRPADGESPSGVVWVHSVRPRIFNADEVAFVQRMAIELARSSAPARPQDALEMLLDDAHQIVARFDHDLRVTYLNREGQRLLGDLIGRTCREAGLPECVADVCERKLRATREQVAEFAVRTRFGERHFETRILPELGPDGSVRSLLSISRDVTEKHKAQSEHVTARQRDVLRLLIRGWSNREIAAELGLAPGTVKNHVADILEQLDVKDRTQAAVRAIELGITLPD